MSDYRPRPVGQLDWSDKTKHPDDGNRCTDKMAAYLRRLDDDFASLESLCRAHQEELREMVTPRRRPRVLPNSLGIGLVLVIVSAVAFVLGLAWGL